MDVNGHDTQLQLPNEVAASISNGSDNKPVKPRGRPPRATNAAVLDEISETELESEEVHKPARPGRPARTPKTGGRMTDDRAIYTLSVTAEILELHPRTLRIYEEQGLVIPQRTATQRRRYSQNDIRRFRFIQYLTRERGVNLSGVRIILALLVELGRTITDPVRYFFPEYIEIN